MDNISQNMRMRPRRKKASSHQRLCVRVSDEADLSIQWPESIPVVGWAGEGA